MMPGQNLNVPQVVNSTSRILPLVAKSKPLTPLLSTNNRATGGKNTFATGGKKKAAKIATGGNYQTAPAVEVRQTSRNVCGVFLRYNREAGRPLVHLTNISADMYTDLQNDKEKYGKFKKALLGFRQTGI